MRNALPSELNQCGTERSNPSSDLEGPKSYDQTEEEMETEQFPFSAQGIEEAVSWLNEKYKEKKALWDQVTYR